MSTGQQLGLIGNSIKVQSLPTASAETFGAGNRFYTLIGQQEGYITGHTYRTVVANDVYSWEDIAQAGPKGEDGLPALVFNDTWGYINVGLFNAAIETFNRTPIVGEKVVIFSTENQYTLATIESVSETTVGVRFSGPIIYTKGADGRQGEAGLVYTKLYSSTINPNVVGSQTITIPTSDFNRIPKTNETFILFNQHGYYLEATVSSIALENNIQVAKCLIVPSKAVNINGTNGAQGIGVKSITSGTPTIVDDKTNTPITITLTDNTTVDLVVSAENGKDGTSETVDIVQATGQSTTAVMSQKAVTDELNKKASTSEVNAKYTKPESGIPKSDLAEDVKTSLGKADTALQNVPSYNDLPNIL